MPANMDMNQLRAFGRSGPVQNPFNERYYEEYTDARDTSLADSRAAVNDASMYYRPETDFGQGFAREDRDRYGFNGMLSGEVRSFFQADRDREFQRIMRMASGMTPGMASMVGGVAGGTGEAGATSQVIGAQRRNQMFREATERGFNTYEDYAAKGRQMEFQGLMGLEGMRGEATGRLMDATGRASAASNEAMARNAGMRADLTKMDLSNRQFYAGQGLQWNQQRMGGDMFQQAGNMSFLNNVITMGNALHERMGAQTPGGGTRMNSWEDVAGFGKAAFNVATGNPMANFGFPMRSPGVNDATVNNYMPYTPQNPFAF